MGQVGPGQVGAGELQPGMGLGRQADPGQVGVGQVGVGQVAVERGIGERNPGQVGAGQVGRAGDDGPGQLSAGQVRPSQRALNLGVGQVSPGQDQRGGGGRRGGQHGTGEVGAGASGPGHLGQVEGHPGELGVGQVGAGEGAGVDRFGLGEVTPGQVGVAQVLAGQVDPGEGHTSRAAAEPDQVEDAVVLLAGRAEPCRRGDVGARGDQRIAVVGDGVRLRVDLDVPAEPGGVQGEVAVPGDDGLEDLVDVYLGDPGPARGLELHLVATVVAYRGVGVVACGALEGEGATALVAHEDEVALARRWRAAVGFRP